MSQSWQPHLLRSLATQVAATETARATLFQTATEVGSLVRPLDQELLNRASAAKQIGQELRGLESARARALGRAIGASAAVSASRLEKFRGLRVASERIANLYRWQEGVTSIADRWRGPLREFAAGMERFVEEQQHRNEQTDMFVRTHGWPVPLHLPIRAYHRVVAMADRGKREVGAFMRNAFRPGTGAFAATAEVLRESPQFESRRPLVSQALAAHRKGQWYLVINALLPLVEGVLVDYAYASQAPPRQGRPEKALKQLRKRENATVGVTVDTLETMLLAGGANLALAGRFDPTRYGAPGEPRSLNRNAILHGAARRYGSEQNALRLVLLLVVMAEAFDLPSRGKSPSARPLSV